MKEIKINGFNEFIELAKKEYPKELCAWLFSDKPFSPKEKWYLYPAKNISKDPENYFDVDSKELQKIKRKAIKLKLVKIGNIHSHIMKETYDPDLAVLPSETDLNYARRFNDIIRGIILVDKKKLYNICFHDKFGNTINLEIIP